MIGSEYMAACSYTSVLPTSILHSTRSRALLGKLQFQFSRPSFQTFYLHSLPTFTALELIWPHVFLSQDATLLCDTSSATFAALAGFDFPVWATFDAPSRHLNLGRTMEDGGWRMDVKDDVRSEFCLATPSRPTPTSGSPPNRVRWWSCKFLRTFRTPQVKRPTKEKKTSSSMKSWTEFLKLRKDKERVVVNVIHIRETLVFQA